MACAGDSDEICGGANNTATVYEIDSTVSLVDAYEYAGCYSDDVTAPTLEYLSPESDQDGFTPELCGISCVFFEYTIFGVEDGKNNVALSLN